MRGILVSVVLLIIFGTTAIILWLQEKRRVDKVIGELDTYYVGLKERRKNIRFSKRLNVVCKVIEKSGSHWSVFSKDVSGDGICLYLPEILPQDAVVDLEIDVADKKRITARGNVVWLKEIETPNAEGKRQFSAGIKFIKISPRDKKALFNFIKKGEPAE